MKVLALDQSTSCVGYCIMESDTEEIVACGAIEIHGRSLDEKISNVKRAALKLIADNSVEAFAIEDIQYQNNQRTYKVLSELLGVLSNAYFERDYLYHVIPPVTWKGYCGIKGKRREEQKMNTIVMVKERFDMTVTEDCADAIGIALYMCSLLRGA